MLYSLPRTVQNPTPPTPSAAPLSFLTTDVLWQLHHANSPTTIHRTSLSSDTPLLQHADCCPPRYLRPPSNAARCHDLSLTESFCLNPSLSLTPSDEDTNPKLSTS